MERFSIKWDSFNDDVKRSFSQLRNEKKFSDVILVSDDHHLVSAHKVVLSTCSIYFNEILKQDLTGSVFFCLEGVHLNDLNNLLDYIYQGELTLPQGHIERFLLMVKRFKLDGFHEDLNQVDKSMNQLDWKMSFPKHEFLKKTDPLSKQIEEADEFDIEADPLSNQVEEADEGIENEYLNSESTYTSLGHITISRPSLVPNSNTCGIKLQSFKDVKEKIKDMYIKHPFEFECKICGKICSKISNIKEHIEIHIEGLRFPCRTCGSEYGSRSGRRVHERVFHKMKPKIKNSFN